jgi:hypothetical protein
LDVGWEGTEVCKGFFFSTVDKNFTSLFEIHRDFTTGEEVKESSFTST